MSIKGASVEVSGGSEEHIIEHSRKGDPCYKMARNLAELCSCSSVLWQVELVSEGWNWILGCGIYFYFPPPTFLILQFPESVKYYIFC